MEERKKYQIKQTARKTATTMFLQWRNAVCKMQYHTFVAHSLIYLVPQNNDFTNLLSESANYGYIQWETNLRQ